MAESHDLARIVDNTGGTDLAAADVAISAGWGSTGALTIRAGSDDTGHHFDIAVAGSGIVANPTITVTFKDGAFHDPAGTGVAQAPKVVTVSRGDANGQAGYFAV